jgi:lipoprotein-releasing system ATP-binding protein
MPMLVDRGRPDAGMRSRADELLESVACALARQPGEQALGRAAAAVRWRGALAMDPALLLADEPTGNLDTKFAQGVFDLMRS